MAHLQEERDVKSVTRDKYKIIARASALKHDALMDKVQDHMMNCLDPDCDICDMGQSGSMIDDDEEGEPTGKNTHTIGSRSSEGREGAGSGSDNIDNLGRRTQKQVEGDKNNLMKHGEHTSKHPGFKAVQSKIASQQGVSKKAAGAILASRTRSASSGAKRVNSRLNRVRD